jgi:3-phenylpropionate/trans-cinnamate dioxygenase ferredoxin reductase subunit
MGVGHAGGEMTMAARQGSWAGRIVLLGEETGAPYQRPPLYKAHLMDKSDLVSLALRPAAAMRWRAWSTWRARVWLPSTESRIA